VTCKYCPETGNHYMGGDMWVCFKHFLACFGFVSKESLGVVSEIYKQVEKAPVGKTPKLSIKRR